MTADDIWGQIEPLVRARIRSNVEQRKEKLTELVWPQLKHLSLITWGVDYSIDACSKLCNEIYSICEEAREQLKIAKSSEFEWTIFQEAIYPEIQAMRTFVRTWVEPDGGKYGSFDRFCLELELNKLELEWGLILEIKTLTGAVPEADSNKPANAALPTDPVAEAQREITEAVIWQQLEPLVRPKIRRFRKWRLVVDRRALAKPPLHERKVLAEKPGQMDFGRPTLQVFLDWHVAAAGHFCERLYDLCNKALAVKGIAESAEYESAIYRYVISPQIKREREFGEHNIPVLAQRVELEPESFLKTHREIFDGLDFDWRDELGLATPSDGLAPAADRTEEVDADVPDTIATRFSRDSISASSDAAEESAPKGFEGLNQKPTDLSHYFDSADLTERQRDCSSLKWEYGLSDRVIARRLGISHTTVQEHLIAAESKMKRKFSPGRRTSPSDLDPENLLGINLDHEND